MLRDEYCEVEEGKRYLQFKAHCIFAHGYHKIMDLQESMTFMGMVYI